MISFNPNTLSHNIENFSQAHTIARASFSICISVLFHFLLGRNRQLVSIVWLTAVAKELLQGHTLRHLR